MTARPVVASHIGTEARDWLLEPDAPARAALAARLKLPGIPALQGTFTLRRERGALMARGHLKATVVQEDVTTLEPFEATIAEDFVLKLVPEEALSDAIDPDDPVDEVGYRQDRIDLAELLAEQLALALDPYPRRA